MISRNGHIAERLGAWTLAAVTALLLAPALWPLITGLAHAVFHHSVRTVPLMSIVGTIWVAASIAALSVALAWFPARAMRRAGFAAVILVPVLMPPYLAYAGYGMVRDPSWWIGNQLALLAQDGYPWMTRWLGNALAIVGLALWSFPLAALVLAASFRTEEPTVEDALLLDAGPLRRAATRVRMHLSAVVMAFCLIALVMIGSAVPLSLAQLPTLAVDLWLDLSESPASEWHEVWSEGWPLFLLAIFGAVLVSLWLARGRPDATGAADRVGRTARSGAWLAWAAAVLGPLAIFITSIRSANSLAEFWRLSGRAVGNALSYSGVELIIAALLASLAAFVAGVRASRSRRIAVVALAAWVFVAIIPGVFIGSALAVLGSHVRRLSSGDLLVVLAHVTRFGVIAIIAGLAAGWSEPGARTELRALDNATGVRGWLLACLPWQWPLLLGGSLAVGIMGIHEIEATTLILPPGRDNLAQEMLDYLHYSRLEELSAASTYLITGGIAAAICCSTLLIRRKIHPEPKPD